MIGREGNALTLLRLLQKYIFETFEVINRKAICWTDVEPDTSEGTKNEFWLKEADIMCSFQIIEYLLNRHHCY